MYKYKGIDFCPIFHNFELSFIMNYKRLLRTVPQLRNFK